MNLPKTFAEGQKGANMGLPMGVGLMALSKVLKGVQRKRIYSVAAAAKGGKTTFVDVAFVIEPALYILENNYKLRGTIAQIEEEYSQTIAEEQATLTSDKAYTPVLDRLAELRAQIVQLEIIYYSYEIDRVSKEFDFVAHFLYRDYGLLEIPLPAGITCEGKTMLPITPDFLMGQVTDDNHELIKVPQDIVQKMVTIYNSYIHTLFGGYDEHGNQQSQGIITFIEEKENPTGIRNYLLARAEKHGTFKYKHFTDSKGVQNKKIVSYTRNNPNEFVLVITDHVRKLNRERGYNMKENIDKYSEYAVELRNHCLYSFVHIIHLNRSIADIQRLKFSEDKLYPMSDDIKETGNLSEDSNYVLTLFNPNDDRYKLSKHFGRTIRANDGKILFPNMRTIHLVDSRHCPFPRHFVVNMLGAVKYFEKFDNQ